MPVRHRTQRTLQLQYCSNLLTLKHNKPLQLSTLPTTNSNFQRLISFTTFPLADLINILRRRAIAMITLWKVQERVIHLMGKRPFTFGKNISSLCKWVHIQPPCERKVWEIHRMYCQRVQDAVKVYLYSTCVHYRCKTEIYFWESVRLVPKNCEVLNYVMIFLSRFTVLEV